MLLRITASTVRCYGGALARRVGNARDSHARRTGLLLTLYAGDLYGVGEASPLPGFSPESVEACEQALWNIHETVGWIESDVPAVEQVAAAVAGLGERLAGL